VDNQKQFKIENLHGTLRKNSQNTRSTGGVSATRLPSTLIVNL